MLEVGTGGQVQMSILRLSPNAYRQLRQIARSSANARQVRRAQALVWLHDGESVTVIARRLGMTRRVIYYWAHDYLLRLDEPIATRITERTHPGRPPRKMQMVLGVAQKVLADDPRAYGYRSPVWTVALLKREVKRQGAHEISTRTARRAFHLIRYRYKRPRRILAHQSPTWRQAKGGSKLASSTVSGP